MIDSLTSSEHAELTESGSSTSAFVADSSKIDFNLELPPGFLESRRNDNQATGHVNRSRMEHDGYVSEAQGEPFGHFGHNQMMWGQDEGSARLSHDPIGWQPPQGEPVAGPSHLDHNQMTDDGPAAGSDYRPMGWGQHGGSVADPYSWLRSSDSILGETGYQSGPFNQD